MPADSVNSEVKVLLFGIIAEKFERSEIVLSGIQNSDELRKELINLLPELAGMKFTVSVDRKIIHEITSLSSNSEVALLPPFSGG